MYKSLESNNDKFAEENKFSYHAPVILCLVPRILWKQGINLVNKFALLLNKCWLREDSWDKPKNDWCWERWLSVFTTSAFNVILRRYSLPKVLGRRIHNVIAKAMSICVAYSNKVMDTPELPQPIKRHVAPKYDSCSIGRSMIEMLGVLAIIAVLSVGGIAGYSKAMQKFKINRVTEQYNYLIFGMLDYVQDAKKADKVAGMIKVAEAVGLIPSTWEVRSDFMVSDEFKNIVEIFAGGGWLSIDFQLIKSPLNSFTGDLCMNLFSNVIKPLSHDIDVIFVTDGKVNHAVYYGTRTCAGNRKCLNNISLEDMKSSCNFCVSHTGCAVSVKL